MNKIILDKVYKKVHKLLGEEGVEVGGFFDKYGKILNYATGEYHVNILDEEVGIPLDSAGSFHTHPFSGRSPKAPRKLRFSNEDIKSYNYMNKFVKNLTHIVIGEDGYLIYKPK